MISKLLPAYVTGFIEALNAALQEHDPGLRLSRIQKLFIGACLMGILVTESFCWRRFERASLGKLTCEALSWMFRKARIPWHKLLRFSVKLVLRRYGIHTGVLVLDDTERRRAKRTKCIHWAHKLKDKKTGGYINGQCLVFLLLVTPLITIPVDFAFYRPDPRLQAWQKEDDRLRGLKVPKRQRPPKPPRDARYPTKQELALQLLARFRETHHEVAVKGVVADALYGTRRFMDRAQALFGTQVISQLRKDQNVTYRGKTVSLEHYFNRTNPGIRRTILIRGHKEVVAWVSSARLYVQAHGRKRFVIAVRYEGETEYRYLVASDLTWRTEDIVAAYSLRWLVEVFLEDWKLYEGWGQLAKHTGEDGSSRCLTLSLLFDHCLLLHPQQAARLESKLPAWTVGSLSRRLRMEAMVDCFRELLTSPHPHQRLEQLQAAVEQWVPLEPSKKHLSPFEIGRLEPSPSLRYRAEAVT